jgi:O-antigen/teichoic acid export membrane protein
LVLAGDQFIEAAPVLAIMNIMIVLLTFNHLFGNLVFMAMGKEKWTLKATAYGLIVNVTMNFLLIPIWGALGAAIATVSTGLFVFVFQLYLINNYLEKKEILKRVTVYSGNAIIMGLVVFFVMSFAPNVFAKLLISIPVGFIVYASLLLLEKNSLAMDLLHTVIKKFIK